MTSSSSLSAPGTTPTLPPEVCRADRALAEIADDLDVLLDLTPVNVEQQWLRWCDGRHEPEFEYRAHGVDPDRVARRIDDVDVAATAGHVLHDLLERTAEELRSEAELVRLRHRPGFVDVSRRLYGEIDEGLRRLADGLLDELEPEAVDVATIPPTAFVERAERELDEYRTTAPSFRARVELSAEVPSLMVVGRRLTVGVDSHLPAHRVEGLIHHEVGVHLLTAETGGRQPLHLLETGTAGYIETQEALGVLAEHLSGGVDGERMRTLAARVVATYLWCEGAGFTEIVDALTRTGFGEHAAWTVTMRIARGGGYTKDAMYLRGLVALADHLARHPIEPLLVGKFHLRDAPLITALLDDGVLEPAAVRPRWLDVPGARERLERIGRTPLVDWVS